MVKEVLQELKSHAPFTILGAVSGILLLLFFQKLPYRLSYNIFYTLHPLHILLSALATASMYNLRRAGNLKTKPKVWSLFAIGYLGAIGIATLSDSIIPYLGEALLRMPRREIHLGFIEKWWLINPIALIGIAMAYRKPQTKFPHFGHVLLSTWASLFHIIMAAEGEFSLILYLPIFVFLFIAVWLPCCISDIIFPLLFVSDVSSEHP